MWNWISRDWVRNWFSWGASKLADGSLYVVEILSYLISVRNQWEKRQWRASDWTDVGAAAYHSSPRRKHPHSPRRPHKSSPHYWTGGRRVSWAGQISPRMSFLVFVLCPHPPPLSPDRQCLSYHEGSSSSNRKNCKRRKRMCTGVRLRVYIVHNLRGRREVSNGKAQDHRRRGYPVCNGISWLWKLCRDAQNTSSQAQTGVSFLPRNVHATFILPDCRVMLIVCSIRIMED